VRIYLACTVRGDRAGVAAARAAAARLKADGHEILTEHLLQDGVDQAEAALTEADVFSRDRAWLDGCDALVAEASGSSYGVGFEVGYVSGRAAETGQRVVVLYDAERRHAVSRLVSGFASAHGCAYAYRSLEDVERIVAKEFAAVPGRV
jgi:2'-deoxynucleoside 5'-phosphate N-hydrolase